MLTNTWSVVNLLNLITIGRKSRVIFAADLTVEQQCQKRKRKMDEGGWGYFPVKCYCLI